MEPQGSFDWSEKQGVRPAKSNYKLKKESFAFSRPVDGSRVKMLLPAVSNTITKCLPKIIWFCKHWYTMLHKGWSMWKIFTKVIARFKKFLTTRECQLCNFSWEKVLGKIFNIITKTQNIV